MSVFLTVLDGLFYTLVRNRAYLAYMTISSPAFINQASIPQKYTCQGEEINPPLQIGNVPDEAQSLALIVDDPDAPSGLFTHWLMWGIAPDTTLIDEDSIPTGVLEGTNSAGVLGYTAPCPPADTGEHHYRFQLFALSNDDIGLQEGANRDDVENAMKDAVIDRAELVGMYSSKVIGTTESEE